MVLLSDEIVLRGAILLLGVVFGFAAFELVHRILFVERLATDSLDFWSPEFSEDLEKWETAICDEFGIMRFSSRKEFEEHCRVPHRFIHRFKKKRNVNDLVNNSADGTRYIDQSSTGSGTAGTSNQYQNDESKPM